MLPIALVVVIMAAILIFPYQFVTPRDGERLITGGISTQTALHPPFQVLVWNIAKGQNKDFANDFRTLSGAKELLLIQEFHNKREVETVLLERDTFAYQIAVSFLFRNKTATGVATGCVAPSVDTRIHISRHHEPIVKTPKAAIITNYAIADSAQNLLVVNIHGINVAGFDALRDQLQQLKPAVERHRGPILFGGDFNTNTQRKREFMLAYMQELGLTEVQFQNDDRMTAPFGSIPLDYVFARGLEVSGAEVMGTLKGSDHKAMVLKIVGLGHVLDH